AGLTVRETKQLALWRQSQREPLRERGERLAVDAIAERVADGLVGRGARHAPERYLAPGAALERGRLAQAEIQGTVARERANERLRDAANPSGHSAGEDYEGGASLRQMREPERGEAFGFGAPRRRQLDDVRRRRRRDIARDAVLHLAHAASEVEEQRTIEMV